MICSSNIETVTITGVKIAKLYVFPIKAPFIETVFFQYLDEEGSNLFSRDSQLS